MRDSLDNKVLEQEKFIILSRCVNSINNTSNQILHAIFRHKCSFKVIILNGNRVLYSPVHAMESTANIRNSTLQFSAFSFLRRKFPSFSNLNKYFFNSFTELKITLFQFSICVIENSRFYTNTSDTINEGREELVCKVRITIQNLSNFGNISYIRDFRHSTLIFHTGICPNGIQNIKGAGIKSRH